VIGPRDVQFRGGGLIMLVNLNRPCTARSSDFEITRPITPCIVLHSVQSLLLIIVYMKQTESIRVMNKALKIAYLNYISV